MGRKSKVEEKTKRRNSLKEEIGSLLDDDSWNDDDEGFISEPEITLKDRDSIGEITTADIQTVIISKGNDQKNQIASPQGDPKEEPAKASTTDTKTNKDKNKEIALNKVAKSKRDLSRKAEKMDWYMSIEDTLSADEKRLIKEVLKATEYGLHKDVKIPRTYLIETLKANSTRLKDAKINLEKLNYISISPSKWKDKGMNKPHLFTLL